MAKKGKKHTILGGVKVSSSQLSEWGSLGGRPRKWNSESERKRWERQQKKGSLLREYKSYGEIQISKYLTCPNCGKVSKDWGKYFNEKGEYIPESYWFDTVKREKTRVKENKFYCDRCFNTYSFYHEKIAVKEEKKKEREVVGKEWGGGRREVSSEFAIKILPSD